MKNTWSRAFAELGTLESSSAKLGLAIAVVIVIILIGAIILFAH